ncbi:MAG: roadblock/LC7 domain-containing protein [Nitrospira sp.]|nr:roadblock/LC7 domain-containing protein [Candidatus Manganitrophaceae bacterium]HIL35748.1 roadblock/LC7 domain-containing protein [Candidatus Manganitrophaceae bacterium]
MVNTSIEIYEEDFKKIDGELVKLNQLASAKVTFLVDKNGQLIASVGETQGLDTTSLASLTAGNIAATGGMAELIGEKEFSILFHEGEKDNIHISLIGQRAILVVVFDHRSSLGLVRLRVKKSVAALTGIFNNILDTMNERNSEEGKPTPFTEITDEDIENLFG